MALKRKKSKQCREEAKKPKQTHSNPFLNPQAVRSHEASRRILSTNGDHDDILEHTVSFLGLKGKRQEKDNQGPYKKLVDSLDCLLRFLEDKIETMSGEIDGPVGSTASMLLPWVTGEVLDSTSKSSVAEEFLWRTLAASLKCLTLPSDTTDTSNDSELKQNVINKALTNRILLRLIPQASHEALTNKIAGGCATICYEILLRKGNFVPSLDVAFQTLLHVIVEDIADPDHNKFHASSIISATLKVLEETLKNANPKTVFQIMSTEESLLKWSRLYFYLEEELKDEPSGDCKDLMRKMLWESFFNTDHHLEGFRSLVQLRGIPSLDTKRTNDPVDDPMEVYSKKDEAPRFQCYQENLLKSLEKTLLTPSPQSSTKLRLSLAQSSLLIAKLLPLLLQGYLLNLTEFEAKNQRKGCKKKASKVNLAQMQLFLFGTATALLWQKLRSLSCSDDKHIIAQHCLEAISMCLKLFFQHDAFVPSDEEKQMTRSGFLESLTVGMLETSWHSEKGSVHTSSSILETLLLLDHRLMHDKLEAVLGFVTLWANAEGDKDGTETPGFLVTLLETYHKLRQFHHVFDSVLAAASKLPNHKQTQQLHTLHSMLSESRVKRAFANAVFDSPALEVKTMFESLDRRIKDVAMSECHTEERQMSLEIAVQDIGHSLLRNVKVEKSTAAAVARYSESIMNSSVQTLCGEDDEVQSTDLLTRYGVKLCGWIIALQMRASFWLGYEYIEKSEIGSSVPPSVRQLLANAAASDEVGSSPTSLIDDLVMLASFRLRKLDYLIHENSLGDSEELSPRHQYEEEAKRLAGLMVRCASSTVAEGSTWQHIAHVMTSWVPYAAEDHAQSLLMWMFSALSDRKSAAISDRKSVAAAANKDKAVAEALINDASFFEIDELSEQIAPCALDTIAQLVQEALEQSSKLSSADELCLLDDPNRAISSPEQFSKLFRSRAPTSANGAKVAEATIICLNGAVRVTKILGQLPVCNTSAVSVKCANLAARIQSVCCQIESEDSRLITLQIELVRFLWIVFARHLAAAGEDAPILLPTGSNKIRELLAAMKDTTTCLLKRVMNAGHDEHVKNFLSSSREIVKAICGIYLRVSPKPSFCEAIVDFSKAAFCNKKKPKELEAITLCSQGRALLATLCCEKAVSMEETAAEDLLLRYCNWISLLSESESTTSPLIHEQARLFAGELFRWASKVFARGIPEESAANLALLVNSLVRRKPPSVTSANTLEATTYMVLGYADTNPEVDKRHSLIDKLLSMYFESQTLNASLCYLVCGLEGESLKQALSKLTMRIQQGWTLGLRLFQLLVRALQAEEQLDVLFSFVEGILRTALAVLDISHDAKDPAKNVVIASSLIVELIQHKRLMTVKERHVALILAQTSKVLQHASKAEDIYSSCFILVAALVQRFPHQTCTCVPSLITVLHSFQRQVLYGEIDDMRVRDRSQKFTRLCELLIPHKDVYKKHVICLLLEFVHCLEHDLSLVRKECLLPSVFYLLDMLSKYEMQQLNTLMDTTAKALFRSVHQSYNKLHAYKCQ